MNNYGQCNHTKYEGCPPCIHDAYRDGLAQGYIKGYTYAVSIFGQPTVSCGCPIEWKFGEDI